MTFLIDGMMCANCSRIFEEKASKMPGVDEISVNYAMAKVKVKINKDYDAKEVAKKLKSLCREIEPKASLVEEKNASTGSVWKMYRSEIIKIGFSFLLMIGGIFYPGGQEVRLILFLIAYLLVAREVLWTAATNIIKGEVFDENFLMSIATIGAFAIGEYAEAVAVILFYSVGELMQDIAVNKSRSSIKDLMDIRPDYANLKALLSVEKVNPEIVRVGDIIIVKPGEKVPLDGRIINGEAQFDTANLTGESVPRRFGKGDLLLSGYINKNAAVEVRVEKLFKDSTASKILDMVENAAEKKAPTERFITKFARYYTPAVVVFALILAFGVPLFTGFDFGQWIYRALVFLVVSCPCALVVSIPLGFFGGIGAASSHGILVKGGNCLEALKEAEIAVFDKTGTLTKGEFSVNDILTTEETNPQELLEWAAYVEHYSNHPIAVSIAQRYGEIVDESQIADYREIEGRGVVATIRGHRIAAGNQRLMQEQQVNNIFDSKGTVVHIAVDGAYRGCLSIYDSIKEDAKGALERLKQVGIRQLVMLTGDNEDTAKEVATQLDLDDYVGNLLPGDKMGELEKIMGQKSSKGKVLFMGDGMNDAPVLARADIGVAMGGLGSDAAIEAADVVIMTDEPSKIVDAIEISKKTMRVVWQNIGFTFAVKIIVLAMGAFGMATIWEAVFADVGVAILAILNAARIRRL